MTLFGWKFSLGYGIFFVLWGVYTIGRGGGFGTALGIAMIVVGVVTVGRAAKSRRGRR